MATRIDDCSLWQAVWLDPRAVHRLTEDVLDQTIGWEVLHQQRPAVPSIDAQGWSPVWEAAAAVTLARLLAASGGARIAFPDGPVADFFRRSVEALLLPTPTARTLVLAGPGVSAVPSDLALVPQHPQTGEAWTSTTATAAVPAVPLAWDLWRQLAFPGNRRLVQAPGTLPVDVLRDDLPPRPPPELFSPDTGIFLESLARLPEVRQPWLRTIYDQVRSSGNQRPNRD